MEVKSRQACHGRTGRFVTYASIRTTVVNSALPSTAGRQHASQHSIVQHVLMDEGGASMSTSENDGGCGDPIVQIADQFLLLLTERIGRRDGEPSEKAERHVLGPAKTESEHDYTGKQYVQRVMNEF